MTPLHLAAFLGYLEIVEYLCENFVSNVNIQTDSVWDLTTPLHEASEGGHLDTVRYLIKKDADPKIKRKGGKTAYDVAIDKNHSDVSNYLQQFN